MRYECITMHDKLYWSYVDFFDGAMLRYTIIVLMSCIPNTSFV